MPDSVGAAVTISLRPERVHVGSCRPKGADVADPRGGLIGKMRAADPIKPIDTARLKAWDELLPALAQLPEVSSEGQVWMLPFDRGRTGLVCWIDLVEGNIDLKTLADPAPAPVMPGRPS